MPKQIKSKTPASSTSPLYFAGSRLTSGDLEQQTPYSLPQCCIVRGTVTNNVDPTGASRVQLSVPKVAIRLWAYVVQSSGKAKSIPKIGKQVAVAFEEGDIRRPLVLGAILGT